MSRIRLDRRGNMHKVMGIRVNAREDRKKVLGTVRGKVSLGQNIFRKCISFILAST